MDKLFLLILNMSLTGAFVIVTICLARLPLKKAPKIISYCLWTVAWFRLVIPFSIESMFSLIPFNAVTIPTDIAMQPVPYIDSGISAINNAVSGLLPAAAPVAGINPLQVWTAVGAYVWITGVAVLLTYSIISYYSLKRKVASAIHLEDNIYIGLNIRSPFILGVLKPGIYIPTGLSEQEHECIIRHEQTHIKRRDHIVKLAAYFALCLHWFNPLAWAAFILMSADMEMSCDERVLKELGADAKKDYSHSLLSMAANRRLIGVSPLAFSEGGLKTRVKNVLKYKKTPWIIGALAVTLTVALSLGLMLNRADNGADNDNGNMQESPRSGISVEDFLSAYEPAEQPPELPAAEEEQPEEHTDTQLPDELGEQLEKEITKIVQYLYKDSESLEIQYGDDTLQLRPYLYLPANQPPASITYDIEAILRDEYENLTLTLNYHIDESKIKIIAVPSQDP